MAIDVLHSLKKEYPEAHMCMVGPDKDGTLQKCKDLAKELGISASIEFTGRLSKEQWHELSKDYDVFVNTTNKDNMPVSVIEAMALGLPVVSTNPGGIPFLIDDGKHGSLVPVGDNDRMVEKIQFLIENPREALCIADNARQYVEQFSWERVKLKWNELLLVSG